MEPFKHLDEKTVELAGIAAPVAGGCRPCLDYHFKKFIIMLFIALFAASGIAFAQQKKTSAEVLYFKANLACCVGKACNALESTVKKIVEKNWADGKVVFRQVKLSDTVNNGLIKPINH